MAHWHYMTLELIPDDALIRPMIGPEKHLTRDQAHAQVQAILDQLAAENPQLRQAADMWRRGAQDDTVYHGRVIWTIYECAADTCAESYATAAEEFAAIMRSAGVDVGVAHPTDL